MSKRTGFSLAELLTTIFIIGLIVMFIVPVMQKTKEDQWTKNDQKRLQCVIQGFLAYQDHYGYYPPAYTVDEKGTPLHSWRVLILPFLKNRNEWDSGPDSLSEKGKLLYQMIRLDEPWDSEENRKYHETSLDCYSRWGGRLSPNVPDKSLRTNGLSVVIGKDTLFTGSEPVRADSVSDPSHTIVFVERTASNCWMDPTGEISWDDACHGFNQGTNGVFANRERISVFPFRDSFRIGYLGMADGSIRVAYDDKDSDQLPWLLQRKKNTSAETP